MKKTRYDYNLLKNFCDNNNIILTKDYSKTKINRTTNIEYNCKCGTEYNKKFNIFLLNPTCKKCTEKNKLLKFKATNLERLGVEFPARNTKVREKFKETCIERYGVEHPLKSEEIKEKIKITNLKNYGVEYGFQSEIVKEKIKETCIKRYGVEHPFQNSELIDKFKKTCIEKYGVEYPLQFTDFFEKFKQTNLERLGVEFPKQSEDIKNKEIQNNLKKYNVCYPIQHEEIGEKIKDKMKTTNLKRYGFCYPMQNPEFTGKQMNYSKHKEYLFPSGNIIHIQGYENYALDKLLYDENIDENDIITSKSSVPEIWYCTNDNIKHRYYMDIFVKSQNRCIEVKSEWTFIKDIEKIELTSGIITQKGYKYNLFIFDTNGIDITYKFYF